MTIDEIEANVLKLAPNGLARIAHSPLCGLGRLRNPKVSVHEPLCRHQNGTSTLPQNGDGPTSFATHWGISTSSLS